MGSVLFHKSDQCHFLLNGLQWLLIESAFFFFLAMSQVSGILVRQPWMELMPSAVEAQSPNRWKTREVPGFSLNLKQNPDC